MKIGSIVAYDSNPAKIAEVLDVSTGRVSQIKKSAIMHLREFIEKANGFAE